jgi:hypothetical protein
MLLIGTVITGRHLCRATTKEKRCQGSARYNTMKRLDRGDEDGAGHGFITEGLLLTAGKQEVVSTRVTGYRALASQATRTVSRIAVHRERRIERQEQVQLHRRLILQAHDNRWTNAL